MRLADEVCRQARALIARRLGLDFPEGRRADLERGLLSACRTASVPVPETYLAWLTTLPAESQEWRRLRPQPRGTGDGAAGTLPVMVFP